MTPHIESVRIVKALSERQEQLGLSHSHLQRVHGICCKHLSQWHCGARQPRLESLISWAAALGMEVVLRERSND